MLKVNTPLKALFDSEFLWDLFLVHFCSVFVINDLPMHITSDIVNADMFAHDTTLNASHTSVLSVQKELQTSIKLYEVSECCSKNAMVLHPAKTKSMLFATRQKHQRRPLPLNLNVKDSLIEQVQEHRHLVVILDDEFSWNQQIASTCKTV